MLCELHVIHTPNSFMALTSSHKQPENFLQITFTQQKENPGSAITHLVSGNQAYVPYNTL
jgi:hypothetical protein